MGSPSEGLNPRRAMFDTGYITHSAPSATSTKISGTMPSERMLLGGSPPTEITLGITISGASSASR